MLPIPNEGRAVDAIEVIHCSNILDVESDFLISSGNPYFNMSGGVNGALLLKYGNSLQEELHQYLKDGGVYWLGPASCYRWKQTIGAYKGVVYCVTVDSGYDCSKELVKETLLTATHLLQPKSGQSVAFPAFGTGYGRLSKVAFGEAVNELSGQLLATYPGTSFYLVERDIHSVEELRLAVQGHC